MAVCCDKSSIESLVCGWLHRSIPTQLTPLSWLVLHSLNLQEESAATTYTLKAWHLHWCHKIGCSSSPLARFLACRIFPKDYGVRS